MIDERIGNSTDTASAGIGDLASQIQLDDSDRELDAMRIISRILAPLDLDTRNRVLAWVERRLEPPERKPLETAEERRHREAVERGRLSWQKRRERE